MWMPNPQGLRSCDTLTASTIWTFCGSRRPCDELRGESDLKCHNCRFALDFRRENIRQSRQSMISSIQNEENRKQSRGGGLQQM